MTKVTWPAPERNKTPILEVLQGAFPKQGLVLELASGTGQHVVHFAQQLPDLSFQPTDPSEANRASIDAWRSELQLPNVLPALSLDVCSDPWPVQALDAMFCANLLHISAWACTLGLLSGASRHLRQGGVLVIYGPFRLGGEHTSESNRAFDADLKARDASWGVRDAEAVIDCARERGLSFTRRVAMPANNQCLIFTRSAVAA
jgi:SAM-dependent methyltransferase